MEQYQVLGIMSGTSLDGVDLAFCRFSHGSGEWNFSIPKATTYPYPDEWKVRLAEAYHAGGMALMQLHADYGVFLGRLAAEFLQSIGSQPDLIASHGHTVFHQPMKGMTCQIGSGAAIAAETGSPVVCDFRTADVAKGGQGAPLVPIGDLHLFSSYSYCLNLGGFANISFQQGNQRLAGDICPVNFVLNQLALKLGHPYDPEGQLASKGRVDHSLLETLNRLEYYDRTFPKSLGREWVTDHILPLFESYPIGIHDLLRTFTEHAAIQITRILDQDPSHTVLVTGGGAYHSFLMKRMGQLTSNPLIVPDDLIVQYKEALIFAFLGVLRMRHEMNCLRSVTGAREDSCGGAVYLP